MICAGSIEMRGTETYDSPGAPWPFNSVLDNAVFMTVFGIVVNDPTQDAGLLQVRLAGTVMQVRLAGRCALRVSHICRCCRCG